MEKEVTIFLDIDGVLNSLQYFKKRHNFRKIFPFLNPIEYKMLDKKKVKLLAHLVRMLNAKVVVSSSWRGSIRNFLKNPKSKEDKWLRWSMKVFRRYHISFEGFTRSIWKEEWQEMSSSHEGDKNDEWPISIKKNLPLYGRGYEIISYIHEHSLTGYFIVFDDDTSDLQPLISSGNCIPTSWERGLEPYHIKKALLSLSHSKKCEEWRKEKI